MTELGATIRRQFQTVSSLDRMQEVTRVLVASSVRKLRMELIQSLKE